MPEIYKISITDGEPRFSPAAEDLPAAVFSRNFNPDGAPAGLEVVCRMGDPDLLHCAVWRRPGQPGGIFALHDKNGMIFAATAATGLEYAVALGYFGGLTANARYGADVFENLEEPDD